MAIALVHPQCDDTLRPALQLFSLLLGSIGMIFGHNDQHGLVVLHFFDTQGYLYLLVVFMFVDCDNITGHLLVQSYELLQVALGLPNDFFQYSYDDWKWVITSSSISQTWSYISEYGFKIYSSLTLFKPLHLNDALLMERFWEVQFWGNQLAQSNCCQSSSYIKFLWFRIVVFTISFGREGEAKLAYIKLNGLTKGNIW